MADKTLKCFEAGCGVSFTFTEGEQTFYAEKGFAEPRRCQDCRAKRKANRSSASPPGHNRTAPAPSGAESAIQWVNTSEDARGGNRRNSNKKRDRFE
jgi:hypothetical protein